MVGITWQQAALLLFIAVSSITGATYTDVLGVLFQLKGMDYNFTGDISCGTECHAYINHTTSYWRVCFTNYSDTKYENETLFKKVSRSRTLHFNTDKAENIITTQKLLDNGSWIPYDIPVDWNVPTYGYQWRPLKDGDCWERGKVNKIQLIGHKDLKDTIKWSFILDSYVDIDPIWFPPFNITDDIVSVDNENVNLKAYPHTLSESGYVTFNLTSKIFNGDIDAIWGFNSTVAKPMSAHLFKPHNTSEIQTYICDAPNWYNYTVNPKHLWCWNTYNETMIDNETNESYNVLVTSLVFDHLFNSYSEVNNAIAWNETTTVDYIDVHDKMNKINFDYGGMDTWYYTKNIQVTNDTEYSIKAFIDVPFNQGGGKYWFCVKPSSMTIQQAYSNGYLYCMDPWWNSTFGLRQPIEINTTTNISDYQFLINVTYDSDIQPDFSDIRFTDDDDNEIPYWIASKVDSAYADVWVKVTVNTTNGTQAIMYYDNNTAVTSQSNAEAVMIFYDDFNRADNSTIGNSWIEHFDNAEIYNNKIRGNDIAADRKPVYIDIGTSNYGNIIEYTGNVNVLYNIHFWWDLHIANDDGYWSFYDVRTTQDAFIYRTDDISTPTRTALTNYNFDIIANTDYDYKWILYPNSSVESYVNDTLYMSLTAAQTTLTETQLMGIGFNGDNTNYVYIDNFRVRKYTSTEPTYSFGAEESSNTAPTVTANVSSPATVYQNNDWLINMTATDPNAGDTITGYANLFVNDTFIGLYSNTVSNNTNTQIANLSYGNFTPGDNLTAVTWASDGTINTSKVNITYTGVKGNLSGSIMDLPDGTTNYSRGDYISLNGSIIDVLGDLKTDGAKFGAEYVLKHGITEYSVIVTLVNGTWSSPIDAPLGWYSANMTVYSEGSESGNYVDYSIFLDNAFYLSTPQFIVTLNNPDNNTITNDNTPSFNFTVDGTEDNYDCELFIDNIGYGVYEKKCYQETANVSTDCGGLDTGVYGDCSGVGCGYLNDPYNYVYDGDWDTSTRSTLDGNSFTFHINYTKPVFSLNNNLWVVKGENKNNLSLLQSCWDYDSNKIILKIVSQKFPDYVKAYCYDGSWNQIGSLFGSKLYEEAMWWMFNITLNNTATIITANDTLSDGTYDWYVNCTAGIVSNSSEIREITIDTTSPAIEFVSPTDNDSARVLRTYTYINWTITEIRQDTVIFNWNGSNTTMSNNYINKTALNDGVYTYYVWINDTADNTNQTETRTITIDTTIPQIEFISPTETNNSYIKVNYTYINLSITETNEDTILLNWNGTNETLSNHYINKTNIADGIYTYYAWINDTADNSNQTEIRTLTIDTVVPEITVYSPTNTTYGNSTIDLNVSADETIQIWIYSLNDAGWEGFLPNTTITGIEGQNNITIAAYDLASNVGYSPTIFFTVDTTGPIINSNQTSIVSPEFNDIINITANVTDTTTSVSYCNFTLTNPNSTAVINNVNGTVSGDIWNSSNYQMNVSGSWTINITCGDILNNKGSSEWTFYIHSTPTVDDFELYPAAPYTTDNLTLNVTCSEEDHAHTITAYWEIYKDNVIQSNLSGNTVVPNATETLIYTVDSGNTSKTEEWIGSVWCGDGLTNSSKTNSTTRTILNTIPVIGSPTLNDSTPKVNDSLLCTNGTFTDSDNDSATWYYRWYNGSALIGGETTDTLDLSPAGLKKGDIIKCSTIASDGTDNATAWTNSSTATIINTAPTTTTPTLDPSSGIYKTTTPITCDNATVYDPDYDSITWLYQWYVDDVKSVTTQNITNSSYSRDEVVLCEIIANDGLENSTAYNSSSVTILNTAPTTPDIAPVTNANLSIDYQVITCENSTDVDSDTIYYTIYGSTGVNPSVILQNTTDTSYNWTSLSEGFNYFKCAATDATNYSSNTTIYNVFVDTVVPDAIEFVNPTETNNSNLSQDYFYVNITFIEINSDTCILDNNGTNYTMTKSGNNCYINQTSQSEGTYDYVVYVNDTFGNINNSETRILLLDTTIPQIEFISPTETNNSYIKVNYTYINLSITETNEDTILLNWNGTNETLSNHYVNKTNIADGIYTYYAWINDTADNSNQTETRTITIDTTSPAIEFVSPTDNDSARVLRTYTYINWTITEIRQDTVIFNWNGSNTTMSNNYINKTSLSDGNYTYYAWSNDTLGNSNKTETRTIYIDAYRINLSFGPANTTLFRFNTCGPDFENLTIQPENQTVTYGIDYICNSGIFANDIQVKLSNALNTNWTWAASNTSILTNLINLTTSYQTIYSNLGVGTCIYIWNVANCSYVSQGPGAYEVYQILES